MTAELPAERVCPFCTDVLCAFCYWMGPATTWAVEVGMRGVPVLEDQERPQ